METQLENKEQLLKSVVESAPFPIGVYEGRELIIILANPTMIKTYGKGNDVIGRSYRDILPELANQEIFDQLIGVLETGIPFHAKNQRVDLVIDGILTVHYFNYSFTPIHDTYGNVYAVMNTAADVTDLNVARQQVLEGEEKLRIAVQSADLGAFEVDLSTGKYLASARFMEICELEEGEVTEETLESVIHPDDRQIRKQAYDESIMTGQLNFEARLLCRDESVKWIRVKGIMLKSDTALPNSILGMVQDITEQKLFAEKLRKLVKKRTRELRRSNEDLLQFAHVVSHDLKEPVRKIKLFNNLLKNELEPILDAKGKKYIDKVEHASERMFMMIDAILNYSSLNASGNPIEQVNLNEIIDNITADLELVIQQKQAIINVDTFPIIEGSPILMHQLFYNLINNALKFSKDGVSPIVTIKAQAISGQLKITVKDNGIGIEEQFTQQIFKAFERLHSKDVYEGTGLGLSLCKKIVERHHGTIEAVGTAGEGAEFIITLPQQQPFKKNKAGK